MLRIRAAVQIDLDLIAFKAEAGDGDALSCARRGSLLVDRLAVLLVGRRDSAECVGQLRGAVPDGHARPRSAS